MKCTCLTRSDDPGMDHMDHCSLKTNVLVFRNPTTQQPVVVPQEVAVAAERPYRAYQHHLAGHTWGQIAEMEQYIDSKAARADVARYLNEAHAMVAETSKREMLYMEITRLNALQAAVWPQAMSGHLPAIRQVVDLVITRSKMLGLTELALAPEADDTTAPRTVIVPNDEDGYRAALERAAEGA